MSEQLQLRSGSAAQVAGYTGPIAECVVDTTNNRLVLQDGVTAGGWAAAKLSEVAALSRTPVNDVSYTALTTDRIIAYTAITASRTVTLPTAASYPQGAALWIADESGACSASVNIIVSHSGADVIDGLTSAILNAAYDSICLMSNGVGKWTLLVDALNQEFSLLSVGTAPDPSNVLSVAGASALFNGANFSVYLNKSAAANTCSFIFEDAFSARAQMGLNGSDNFSFKVSPSGSTWTNALAFDATTGAATFANQRTPVADASYTALATDRLIAYTAITAARTVTLPASSAYPPGQALYIVDESGSASSTNAITISRAGADTIDGAASIAISSSYGVLALESNGAGKWTLLTSASSGGPSPSSTTPLMDGTAAVGVSLNYARADHVHPSDTSRAPTAGPTFTGTVNLPAATNFNSSAMTAAATTAIGTSGATLPLLSTANTWSSKQTLPASAAGAASINLAPGSAPTSPVNGDVWTTSAAMFVQINGAIQQLASSGRTAVADAAYTASLTDRLIAYTSITAPRIVTLSASSALPGGQQVVVVDETGSCSATNTITVTRAGTDTINGSISAVISSAYGFLTVESNGAGKWTIVDQSTLGMAQQAANAVAITGGAINGATVGATTASTGAFTTLLASSTVSGAGFSSFLAAPPAIGGTTPAAGAFTTLSTSALASFNLGATTSGGTLTVGAGTTTIAPLKMQSGTNLTTAAAGAFEYDGTAGYFSPAASTRGVLHSEYFEALTAAYTLTSQTAAQKLLNGTTNGAVTLPVGTYQFECLFSLTAMSATSGSYGFALGGSATFTQSWWATANKATLATPSPDFTSFNTAANTALATANTTTTGYALIKGIVRVTTAGTIIPQVSLTVAAAAIVGSNSYFKVSPLGAAAVVSVGNWS